MLALGLALLFADIIAILILQAGGLRGSCSAATPWFARGDDRARRYRGGGNNPVIARRSHSRPRHRRRRPSCGRLPKAAAAEKPRFSATSKVTFGYVLSGDRTTDDASRAGLLGLAKVLETRTAVEPGEPAGVEIAKDEIAFFPILYWPVLENAEALPDAAIAKIDAYMKEGGLIIFDTRDYGQGGSSTLPTAGKGGNALQRLLSKLDVPRLEAVPENHVVTKSFYLLRSFPGRWDGGQLWVEAISENPNDTRRARVPTALHRL